MMRMFTKDETRSEFWMTADSSGRKENTREAVSLTLRMLYLLDKHHWCICYEMVSEPYPGLSASFPFTRHRSCPAHNGPQHEIFASSVSSQGPTFGHICTSRTESVTAVSECDTSEWRSTTEESLSKFPINRFKQHCTCYE